MELEKAEVSNEILAQDLQEQKVHEQELKVRGVDCEERSVKRCILLPFPLVLQFAVVLTIYRLSVHRRVLTSSLRRLPWT